MVYGEPIDTILNILSSTFNLPQEWFVFPQIIFFFVIPLISLIFLWNFFLNKIRIFKNQTVNFGFGIIIALVSTPLIPVFGPAWILAIGIGGSAILSGSMSLWRAALALILFFASFYIYGTVLLSLLGLSY